MTTATVTSKGQITIPFSVRTALRLKRRSKVEFVELDNGQFAIVAVNKDVRALKGLLSKPATPVDIEQMNATIAARGASSR